MAGFATDRPLARLVATDGSSVALGAARLNAVRHSLGARIEFVEGSWYEPLSQRTFDVIVSNPPYIAADDPRVEPSVRRFEPPPALFAGPTGLEALRAVVAGAPRHLAPGGWLAVEHGDEQGESVRELFVAAGFTDVRTHRDLSGRDRCTEGRIAAVSDGPGHVPRMSALQSA